MAETMIRRLTARDARLSSFRFYDLLVHVFVVVLLISNLVGQKICAIPLFNFQGELVTAKISGAQLLFPITYIFGDIFTEVYGYGASRRAIWLGFFACAVLSLFGLVIVAIPAASDWPNQAALGGLLHCAPLYPRQSRRLLARRIHQFLHARENEDLERRQMALDADRRLDRDRTTG